ncbi:hypothetical protein KCV87_05580 [Actinosynnema pretiosum subsp. pretiosum]|uniref:Uncharacterized protein n=1 Tax=Actinosynnema pretiosum subsp. pretiosum TaxID=103721 RepID=A0AA45L9D3_9PSEU|nr:hypothetical protein APASM_2908 [Actinosynnema pretiosum subsp. pretiosum]QUF05570.1 hypothetical protein KCV87_05580 [Actinosynnema pretiosum subsp. pretiosum]
MRRTADPLPEITAGNLPTPELAERSTDPAVLRRVRGFAESQAAAARVELRRLLDLAPLPGPERVRAFESAHARLVKWRYETALRTPSRLGRGLPHDPERFRVRLADDSPNCDRLGYLGRLRDGSTWNGEARLFTGGADTPAHRVMLRYGQRALARFEQTGTPGDELRNLVVLPDGQVVVGNSLVRGDRARRVGRELAERVARRQGVAPQMELGGEPLYAVTAPAESRSVLFAEAMRELGHARPGDVAAWQRARYLLYQAPLTKKGSDAVTRTFLVAVGAFLLGTTPTLEQDADLRCMVDGQEGATAMPGDPLVEAALSGS